MTKKYHEYGYKVIFASEYTRKKVEDILGGHIEEALAELGVSFACDKTEKKVSYFLEMTKAEREKSIEELIR